MQKPLVCVTLRGRTVEEMCNDAPKAVKPQVNSVAYKAPSTGSMFSKKEIKVSISDRFFKSFANLVKLL